MNQLERLSEPFPAEVERTLRKGGTTLTYIPVSEVIARLNNVLGVNGWSYSVKDCGRDSDSKDWIIALCYGIGGIQAGETDGRSRQDRWQNRRKASSDLYPGGITTLSITAACRAGDDNWAGFRGGSQDHPHLSIRPRPNERRDLSQSPTPHRGG